MDGVKIDGSALVSRVGSHNGDGDSTGVVEVLPADSEPRE